MSCDETIVVVLRTIIQGYVQVCKKLYFARPKDESKQSPAAGVNGRLEMDTVFCRKRIVAARLDLPQAAAFCHVVVFAFVVLLTVVWWRIAVVNSKHFAYVVMKTQLQLSTT